MVKVENGLDSIRKDLKYVFYKLGLKLVCMYRYAQWIVK
jgi:hypothetical protein